MKHLFICISMLFCLSTIAYAGNDVPMTHHPIGSTHGGNSVLRIKGNLTLCDNTQIYVDGGGTLIVDGGTINNAKINLDIDSSLNVINDGIINMRQNQSFYVPVGAEVNITEGQVNNY